MSKCIVGAAAFRLPRAVGEERARAKGYEYTHPGMMPVALEHQLLPGTLEFALQAWGERRMDPTVFERRDKTEETGCPAYEPKILLKVIVFG